MRLQRLFSQILVALTLLAAPCLAQLSIQPTTLPGGVLNDVTYPGGNQGNSVPFAVGGTAPYHWTLVAGTLPAGVTLQPVTPYTVPSSNGPIGPLPGALAVPQPDYVNPTNTITQAGTFSFTLQVTDSSPTPLTATQTFQLSVANVSERVDPLSGDGPGPIVVGPDGAFWYLQENPIYTVNDPTGAPQSCYGIGRTTTGGATTT